MLAWTVIVLRAVQYAGAMVLMGSSLFLLYALPATAAATAHDRPWPRPLLGIAAASLVLASILGLLVQTAILAGSVAEGLKASSLAAAITTMAFGPSSLARTAAALLALGLLIWARPGRALWWAAAGLGAVACASFAWMGHGAATEGAAGLVHLVSDIIHALAAAIWIGALVAFLMLLRPKATPAADDALHAALAGFSGIGAAAVAAILATGLINGWFAISPDHWRAALSTPYGQLLALKVLLFAAMVLLAAVHRFRLTPALGLALGQAAGRDIAIARLRRSVLIETALAGGVLALVAWLGTLDPVAAR